MGFKIAHWSLTNGSGLNSVAVDIAKAETALGHDSKTIPTDKIKDGEVDKSEWEWGMDADVHVAHSHIPDDVRDGKGKIMWIGHGTPEVCFQSAALEKQMGAWGLVLYWLKEADANVTFWDRHKYIWESMCNKGRTVDLIPMGVDKEFWKPVKSRGKYAGEPSFLTNENSHQIKWCFDIAMAWPEIYKKHREARLHINYIPSNQLHAFYPLFYGNGTQFSSFITGNVLSKEDLRNAFVSIDYYISPVQYGDFNRICLEAKASGCKVISYAGNPYADYWLTLQDQRSIAQELIQIAKGEREARQTKEIPDIKDTASALIKIYERICNESNPVKSKPIKERDNGDVPVEVNTPGTDLETVEGQTSR